MKEGSKMIGFGVGRYETILTVFLIVFMSLFTFQWGLYSLYYILQENEFFFFLFFINRIIESKNSDYNVGTLLVSHFGWSTHMVLNSAMIQPSTMSCVIPEIVNVSDAIGILGLTGLVNAFLEEFLIKG